MFDFRPNFYRWNFFKFSRVARGLSLSEGWLVFLVLEHAIFFVFHFVVLVAHHFAVHRFWLYTKLFVSVIWCFEARSCSLTFYCKKLQFDFFCRIILRAYSKSTERAVSVVVRGFHFWNAATVSYVVTVSIKKIACGFSQSGLKPTTRTRYVQHDIVYQVDLNLKRM